MSHPPSDFLVVGVGASAGGVEALQAFFTQVAPDSGCAYVVILHLAPEYESNLASILQAVTSLPVTVVTEVVRVEPDHVYVVPPNQHLAMVDGELRVSPNTEPEERRAPIDIFYRTLAESHQRRGVCVILSGSGSDGSMGLKRVKERGGAVFAQSPRETTFAEMPRSAIATDLVDAVLPVAEIPTRIVAYRASLGSIAIPEEPEHRPAHQQQALREIFAQLRAHTGHDFTNYKRATLLRRIERRISVRNLSDLEAYAALLREQPEEVQALLKDLLISVTNFFRDKEAFAALEQEVLPRIFAGKGAGDEVRLWVVGCATGEEAYSLAMLCAERAFELPDAPGVQVFATDIDEPAIARARAGLYTPADVADVSAERLRRFFTLEDERYRVRPELRELVLFANHNVLADPPFSHLDLVSCRNVLIYLDRIAQERVIETFHFALEPGGYLFLGNVESTDGTSGLFAPLSREHRLFQRRPSSPQALPVPVSAPVPRPTAARPPALPSPGAATTTPPREPSNYGGLHLQLPEQYAPPSLLVNQDFELVHVSERAGRYLQFSAGEPTRNLLGLVRPELRVELRSALYQALQGQSSVNTPPLPTQIEGRTEQVTIRVRPTLLPEDPARGLLLVLFEPSTTPAGEVALLARSDEPATRQLEEEVARLKLQLRTSSEQYEYQAEELRATNEEQQALVEELRASSEELHTSKEELQATNEELRTVNQELKVKIEDATQTSVNLQNLVNSTDIATIFLDRSLRVRLFTPAARTLFNLIPADYGRLLSDLTHQLGEVDVLAHAETVLATLQPVEREVRTTDGRVYVLRVLPYRAAEDRIGGVVLTFFDITARTLAEAAVRASEEQFRRAIEEAPIPVIMQAEDGEVLQISRSWTELTGYTLADVPTLDAWLSRAYGHGADAVRSHMHALFAGEQRSLNVAFEIRTRAGELRHWSFSASSPGSLRDGRRFVVGMALDITERTRAERALAEQARLLDLSNDAIIVRDVDNRIVYWNRGATELYGWTREEAVGQDLHTLLQTEFEIPFAQLIAVLQEQDRMEGEVVQVTRDGRRLTLLCRWSLDRDAAGKPGAILTTTNNITERKRVEQALRESERDFRAIFEGSSVGKAQADPVTRRLLRVNPALCAITGYSEAELLALAMGDLTHPDDRERDRELFERLARGASSYQLEKRYLRKDGSAVWVNETSNAIRDAEGQVARTVAVIQDISERVRAEAALHESEARLQVALGAAELGTFVWHVAENRTEADARALAHFGLPPDSTVTLAEALATTFHPEDGPRYAAAVARAIDPAGPGTLHEEFRVRRPDRQERWMAVSATTTFEGTPRTPIRLTGVLADVTERKHREANQGFLVAISEDLSRLSREEEIIRFVGAKLAAHLQLTCYHYVDVNDERAEVTIRYFWHALHVPDILGTYPIDGFIPPNGLTSLRAGETSIINDAQHDLPGETTATAALKAGAAAQKIGAYVAVPYSREGRWKAYFAVADSSPRQWMRHEIELIQEVSNRMFPRLERARAEALVEADLRDTQILQELSARLVSEENVQTMYAEIMAAAIRITRADAGTVQIFDVETKELVLLATSGFERELTEYFHRVGADSSTSCGIALKTDERAFVDFDSNDADKACRLHVEAGYFSAQSTPLVARSGEPIGMLSTHWHEPKHRPSERELGFLDLLARQAADLIEQRQTAERLRQAAEMDAFRVKLSDVLRPLAGPLSIQQAALRCAAEQLDLDRLLYNEIDADVTTYTIRTSYVREGFAAYGGVQPMGPFTESVRALQQGITKVVYDVETDETFSPEEKAHCARIQVRAFVTVPLLKDGRWVLNLVAHSSKPRPWTPLEVRLLEETAERTWAAMERARAEEALHQSEEQLRIAVTAAGMYGWAIDIPTMTQSFIGHVDQIMGFSRLDISNPMERISRFTVPEDGEKHREALVRTMRGEGDLHTITRVIHPNTGALVWMEAFATLLRAADGAPLCVVGVGMNITERKRRELNAAVLDEIGRELAILSAPDDIMQTVGARLGGFLGLSGCYFVDVDEANNEGTVHHGWAPDQVPSVKQTFRLEAYVSEDFLRTVRAGEVFILRDMAQDKGADAERYAGIQVGSLVTVPFVRDGRYTAHLAVTTQEPRDWRPDEIQLLKEISYRVFPRIERARAEAALRASEARFRTLTDAVPQVIWANDAAGKAIYFNQRWYDYSGLSYEQSAGPGWQVIVHPDDAPASRERWQQALAAGTVFDTEYRLRRADGVYRWFLGRNVPLRDEAGRIIGWFGSATDIEELKQAEAARRESAVLRRLADAQEEERLRIARDLHDQLGQLITGLLLGLEQLEGQVANSPAAVTLAPLQTLALELAKESHRIAVNLRPTALEDVGLVPALERLVADWSAQSGVPAAFASLRLGKERLSRQIEVALFRVAQEALTNIQKHAEATSVSVLIERRDSQIVLIVEDNGRGFPVDEVLTEAERPHLGVLGMRERVTSVGGTLEIETSPGKGTTLFVRIPLEPSDSLA